MFPGDQRSIVSAQSSCFNFKIISVTDFNSPGITNFVFTVITDIVIASGNPSVSIKQTGLPGA